MGKKCYFVFLYSRLDKLNKTLKKKWLKFKFLINNKQFENTSELLILDRHNL